MKTRKEWVHVALLLGNRLRYVHSNGLVYTDRRSYRTHSGGERQKFWKQMSPFEPHCMWGVTLFH